MLTKNIFALLIAAVFIQVSLGRNLELHEAKEEILNHAFLGFKNFTSYYVKEAQNISNFILKDENLNNNKNDEIEQFKSDIVEFIDKSKSYKDFEEFTNLIGLFQNLVQHYEEVREKEVTPSTTLITNLLSKYGADQLDAKTDSIFNDFMKKFIQEFEEKKSSLAEDTALLDWFDELKQLTNKSLKEKVSFILKPAAPF